MQPFTSAQRAADSLWQEYAGDYALLLQADEQKQDGSAFLWLAASLAYLSARTGRTIPARVVRGALLQTLKGQRGLMDDLSRRLIAGQIKPDLWRAEFESIVNRVHLNTGALARGGWGQLSGADLAFIDGKTAKQLEFLENFLKEITGGKQKLSPQLIRRARMYIDAGWGTYSDMRQRMFANAGYVEERRVRGAKDSCADCIEYAAQGWQPMGTLPRIGDSRCRTNCRCYFEYRDLLGNVGA
jgi:hypothetical protein